MTTNRREEGSTLLEALVALAIIGIAVTAVLGALATGIDLSALDRTQSEAEANLRNYAERIHAAAFISCAVAGDYDYDAGDGITISEIEYWIPTPLAVTDLEADFDPICPSAALDVAHRITIELESDDPRVGTLALEVVKRAAV